VLGAAKGRLYKPRQDILYTSGEFRRL
jgi:hypothetical protein